MKGGDTDEVARTIKYRIGRVATSPAQALPAPLTARIELGRSVKWVKEHSPQVP